MNSRQKREKCWAMRDLYFQCLDENKNNCDELLKKYEQSCPKIWVEYFSIKRTQNKATAVYLAPIISVIHPLRRSKAAFPYHSRPNKLV